MSTGRESAFEVRNARYKSNLRLEEKVLLIADGPRPGPVTVGPGRCVAISSGSELWGRETMIRRFVRDATTPFGCFEWI